MTASAVGKWLIAGAIVVMVIATIIAVNNYDEIDRAHQRAIETIDAAALQGARPVVGVSFRGHSWPTEQAAMRSGECDFGIERDFTRQPNPYVCTEEEEPLEEHLLLTYATAAEAEQHGPCAHMRPGDERLTRPDETGRFRCDVQSGNRN
jgi:hypothetical protein